MKDRTRLVGRRLQRGVARYLRSLGMATLEEFAPCPGLRVDVLGLGADGRIVIVECKSGPADLAADRKWMGYLDWCDAFYWAVAADFPLARLPERGGILIADAYGAALHRDPAAIRLAGPRRQALIRRIAMTGLGRLTLLTDPDGVVV